jgi:hypothetical protein
MRAAEEGHPSERRSLFKYGLFRSKIAPQGVVLFYFDVIAQAKARAISSPDRILQHKTGEQFKAF